MKKHSLTAVAAALAILPLMLVSADGATITYYALLVLLPVVKLWKARSISVLLIIGLISAGIGILLSNPLPVFRPWERLAMFALMLAGIGPLFGGEKNELISRRLFGYLTFFCLIIGAASAVCAAVGINYGAGGFSGLTAHSMLLGPLSGIGVLYALHGSAERHLSGKRWSLFLSGCGILCLISELLAASRSALLATAAAALYLLLRMPRGKGMLLLILGLVCLALLPFTGDLAAGILGKMDAAREAGSIFSSRAELWHDRWEEFSHHPFLGVGFASQSIITFTHSAQSGIIEPGSSYLGSLSMLGLTGAIPLFLVIARALYRGMTAQGMPRLSTCVLIFFCVHMAFEGYLLSAGSILCILLWSCISAIPTSVPQR